MRIHRGTPVAGLDPEFARSQARAVHADWTSTELAAYRVRRDVDETTAMLTALHNAGDLDSRAAPPPFGGGTAWATTGRGGALSMASFLRPISRGKAETLVAELLQRVRDYNANPTRLLVISEVGVFGSDLYPDVTELGDVDLTLTLTARAGTNEPGVRQAYARRSGRRFASFLDGLHWPDAQARQLLRQRSP